MEIQFLIINNFKPRPSNSNGLWVHLLLPISVILSNLKHSASCTPTYKLALLLCSGMILISLIIFVQYQKQQRVTTLNIWTITALIAISVIFKILLHRDLVFSLFGGLFSTVIYLQLYKFVLTTFKKCFTLGEAGIISQGLTLFLYSTILNIFDNSARYVPIKSNMQIATLIIQLGLLGIGFIAFCCYIFSIKNAISFYILFTLVIVVGIISPLHFLLGRSPILWILFQLTEDWSVIKLVIYWIVCSTLAVLAINNQIQHARKASTGTRKIFHLLAMTVYIPGFLFRCHFLYLASGVILGIFLALEIFRALNIPPLGKYLQDGFVVFSDEKDEQLALTPIYLLVGCSLPVWIYPSPCDVTDSASFNLITLLSGILSIGVGDTAASVIGSTYGKIFWSGSKKTMEGSLACILSQIGLIYLLIYCGYAQIHSSTDMVKLFLAIFITSVVEAKTTQIDNLVLPFIMYILLV